MNLETLREMGEWMALGYYEALAEPWPVPYGRAWRRLYENMEIRIPEDRLLLPCEPLPRAMNMAENGQWWAQGLMCDFDHNRGLRIHGPKAPIVQFRTQQFPHHAAFIDDLIADMMPRLPHFGGYTHSNPDIRRVVREGFLAMRHELDAQIEIVNRKGDAANPAERNLLRALDEYTLGVATLHQRTLAALHAAAQADTGARRDDRIRIATAWERAFLHPAESFLEGFLAVHFCWILDGCDSIGRPDQALGTLYEADVAANRLDSALARRLLDEMWGNFERFNGWNLQIGGYTPEGRDGCNALTMECIAACDRNRFRRPNVALRVTPETPDSALHETLRVLGRGSGRPTLYHDEAYVRNLMDQDMGLTIEDAREVGFGGCTETMIAGLSNVGSLEGTLNLAKALELALFSGQAPADATPTGPDTGAFSAMPDFVSFLDAFRSQARHMTDVFVQRLNAELSQRFEHGDPKLYRTFFTRDCVRRRRSFEAGGARYNASVVSYHGIGNLIDALAAIRQTVFTERSLAPALLLDALRANFEGFETVRETLRTAPKFGNDIEAVDALGHDIMTEVWNMLRVHKNPRGGPYLPSCILFTTYGPAGAAVGALPDGRTAGEPLADSVGPVQGRDQRGPTAMLRSVTRLPLHLAIGTPVLNIRFQKALLSQKEGIAACTQLIRSYFRLGGLQIQVSSISRDEMLAAQRDPAAHADLIVRIGGFSEFFVKLSPTLQDSVLARTEHSV